MIDIDSFKNFNDHYGHQLGDHCLQKVAAAVRSAARRTQDLVGRYGGEEIIVLLPGAESAYAEESAERIVTAIRELGIAHAAAPGKSKVTVSVGFACAKDPAHESAESCIRRADVALYRAKEAGRDQWIGAVPEQLWVESLPRHSSRVA